MGINTDLNVDPYYDDFDEAKQFNRVLFKPAKAVQARELTQLQTILQKQVERFGSNVYKEGTIISGINLTARDDLFFVKLNDQAGFADPTVYNQIVSDDGTTTTFTVTGQTSGLTAEIIKGENGFQTQDPDLKTFFIKYLNTSQDNQTDVKQFLQGELLEIRNSSNTLIADVTVASVSNHVGRSFGISCEEGVIYQKGHFIFVDNQFIIVSKYSNTPGSVSVGFTVKENLIDSDADTTLLDNASGFNNENAPGADRLQLVPTLVSYSSASEPTEFFALIRYVNGKPVRIRDKTEFNTITKELARRTFEESGDYVVNGLKVTLEKEGNTPFAVVSPGKAYVRGQEVTNVSSTKLAIPTVSATQSKTGEQTGISYGQYFAYNHTADQTLTNFVLDGQTRYDLKKADNTVIGTCSISNVTPGKIFVYGIVKNAGEESTPVGKIGSTAIIGGATNPVSSVLEEASKSSMIFDTGKSGISSIQNVSVVKRVRDTSVSSGSNTVTLTGTATEKPLVNDIYALDASNNIITATAVYAGNDVTVTLSATDPVVIYYNVLQTNVAHDTLSEEVGYVKTVYDTKGGQLGVPNAIEIVSVKDAFGATGSNDVTSKFRLVKNQKDGYYGRSFIQLYAGESLSDNNLLIEFRYLKRTSTVGGGYLIANSYDTVTSKNLVHNYTSKSLIEHNLVNSYDFRPYASNAVSPSLGTAGAPTVNSVAPAALAFPNKSITPANNATVIGNQTYFMSRIDSVVIDEYSNISLLLGGEDENPSVPRSNDLYAIANITIPGNSTSIKGEDKISILGVSNKNYTMKDIGEIEEKVDGLIDVVSLSLLEQETNNLDIRDGSGANRFKNGIMADSIKDLNFADIRDPEFRAAIDKGRTVATPAVKQFPVDLKVNGSTGANTAFPDVVTIADTGTKSEVISQPYATNFRNCVSNFYSYEGKAVIDPPFNSGYDVIKNPEVNLEIDIATPMLDLVDNLQEFLPLTTEQFLGERRTGTTRPRRRVIMGQFTETFRESSLTSSVDEFNQQVGNFITDINMKPFLRRQQVKVLVTGLRPNTRHYFFFDQKSVDSHVAPGKAVGFGRRRSSQLDVSRVRAAWKQKKGSPVRTDSNGVLSAVFTIPAETFFVGQNVLEIVDVDTYTSIDSASTSYGRATYRGYNFDINKTDLSVTTRTPDFDTAVSIIERETERRVGDPIAQTFKVKSSSTNDANIALISDVDVFFKKKSSTAGVTLQIREVANGYPSKKVLPFAAKHLDSSEVNISNNGTSATSFVFDNPVKLAANKEYAIVVIPDANNPDYLIYTSKVGATSLSKGSTAATVAVTSDWGDGVLFTSTNDSAWKSYQDEDIKFTLKRYDFNSTGSVDLVPNDMEFLTIRDTTVGFLDDELAYIKKSQSYTAGISGDDLNIMTISGSTVFAVGDYVYLEDSTGANDLVAKILDLQTSASATTITLDTPFFEATSTATAFVCVAGNVSYFNPRKANELHLKGSSATSTNYVDDNPDTTIGSFTVGKYYTITGSGSTTDSGHWTAVGATSTAVGTFFKATAAGTAGDGTARENSQVITGIDSGATATIDNVFNSKISYFQPQVYTSDSIRTSTALTLYNGSSIDKNIPKNANVYTMNNLRTVSSKSKIVNASDSTSESFKIRVAMANNSFSAASPIIDKKLSEVNAYQYHITNTLATTSSWVAKEVVLKEGLEADGLRVLLAGYRPPGTFIDVYARFVYPENIETKSDFIKLTPANPELYSNTSNTKDYREFEYDLDEVTYPDNYRSFQIKIVLRHGTTGAGNELDTPELNAIVPDINLFPHVFDYRAIALT